MKKFALLMLAGLSLSACGSTGTTQEERPYTIWMEPLGYAIDDEGKITIPSVRVRLFSAAGAMDVRSIDYTAVMLNTSNLPATLENSNIVPANGNLFGGARGGYICASTAPGQCSWMSSDANFANTGPSQWPENEVLKFIMPFEWALAHSSGFKLNEPGNDTAGWYAQFTFKAVMSNGQTSIWKQNYQIVAPAGT